jgi:hypothetical protein
LERAHAVVVAGLLAVLGALAATGIGWLLAFSADQPDLFPLEWLLAVAACSLAGLVAVATLDWLRVRRGRPPSWTPAVVAAVSQGLALALLLVATL